MSIWTLYIIAILPLLIGGVFWITNKEVTWLEWIISSVISFAIAGIVHMCAVSSLTADVETWSGQITHAKQFSAWKEYYEYAVYRTEYYTKTEYYTDSKGRTRSRTVRHSRKVFDHWEPTSRWHSEHFKSYSNIDTEYSISKSDFDFLSKQFNDRAPVAGNRRTGEHNSRMIEGDPNDYLTNNKTGWIQPVTKLVHFENRIKAAPSTFSFLKVPKEVKVFPYPKNDNPFHSDRLIGSAALLDALQFDQMNSRLGPNKKVNVILVGMGNVGSFDSQWQESAWLRGKKNDIVIVFGGLNKKPTWVKTFSWGEGLALKNIETLLLREGVSNQILPKIEEEIKKNFVRGDWSRFNYITIEMPMGRLWIYIVILIVVQTVFWFLAFKNDFKKYKPLKSKRNTYNEYLRYGG